MMANIIWALMSAVRGLQEEIGLTVSEEDMIFTKRFIWDEYNHIIDVFFIQIEFDIEELTPQPGEVIGIKAIPKQEMLALVANNATLYRPAEYGQVIRDKITKIKI